MVEIVVGSVVEMATHKPAQRSWSILDLSYKGVTAVGIVVEVVAEIVATEIVVEILAEKATLDVHKPVRTESAK